MTESGSSRRNYECLGSTASRNSVHLVTGLLAHGCSSYRDSAGRSSSVTLPWGAQKSYAYADNDANPETVTLPQGTTLSFQYDAAKRETRRTSSLGETRSFTYGRQDRIQTMTDATGTTTYEYDAAGRFAGIVYPHGGYPHGGSVRYVRDALGRTVEQSVRTSATATPLVTTYAYDAVGNLSRVTDPQGGQAELWRADHVVRRRQVFESHAHSSDRELHAHRAGLTSSELYRHKPSDRLRFLAT